ncbi:MAG: hypothetical protein M0R17_03825 [Candidatus Omnitrophica bacterium]|jgi:hypothetical protein|nr:hypothetical protein [Candidatus Omnitrophota bacterium]
MKCFKGFDKNLQCRDFQYEIGKTYVTDHAELCQEGFHACTNPLDVFTYYNPAESRFCEVELDGIVNGGSEDSKQAGTKITIIREIDIIEYTQLCAEYMKAHSKSKEHQTKDRSLASNSGHYSVASNSGYGSVSSNSGYCSVARNSGDRSVASNSGDCSLASNSGYCSVARNSGDRSVASNSGDWSVASNSGHYSVASNSGNRSVASNSGNRSVSSNSGNWSVSSNSGNRSLSSNSGHRSLASTVGDSSQAIVSGEQSLAVAFGPNSKAKGALGDLLTLVEWADNKIINYRTRKIDGKHIKANTFYEMINGKFVETE